MITQGAVLAEVAVLSHKRFVGNERDIRLMTGAVQKTQILVGNPVEVDEKFEGPTLWTSTSFIADEVIRMNEGIVGMEKTIRSLERSVREIKLEFERLSVAASNDKMLKVLVMVTNKMKEASQQIVELKTKVGDLEEEVSKKGDPRVAYCCSVHSQKL